MIAPFPKVIGIILAQKEEKIQSPNNGLRSNADKHSP
jgi:hypothetical protein